VCDLETSRMGAPYIYDISHLRVKLDYNIMKETKLFCDVITEEHNVIVNYETLTFKNSASYI